MLRTDTGNFNRFLASLGLLLLAAALLIPYFYFQNTEILRIHETELNQLTGTGKATLEDRQDAIAALEPWVISASVLLGLLGIALLIIGGRGLKAAQTSEEEETELRKKRAQAEIRTMSPEEREQKVEEQVQEELPSREAFEAGLRRTPQETAVGEDMPRGGDAPPGTSEAITSRVRRQRAALRRIEERFDEVFAERELPTHQFKSHLKISTMRDSIAVDGLFEAQVDQVDNVLLDLRTAPRNPDLVRRNSRNLTNELIALLSRYRWITMQPAVGWLVEVIPTDWVDRFSDAQREMAASTLQHALGEFGKATLVAEGEMASLPDIFLENFGAGTARWRREPR